jgi:hypothetical protein
MSRTRRAFGPLNRVQKRQEILAGAPPGVSEEILILYSLKANAWPFGNVSM